MELFFEAGVEFVVKSAGDPRTDELFHVFNAVALRLILWDSILCDFITETILIFFSTKKARFLFNFYVRQFAK